MAVLGYTLVSVMMILIQTALLPQIPLRPPFDLLVVQVAYTALTLPRVKGGVVVLVTGLLVDGLSGSPFGFYLTSYLWLFISLQFVTQVLHVDSRILIYLSVLVGILLENLVALIVLSSSDATPDTMMWAMGQGGRQLLWAVLVSPLVYALLRLAYRVGGGVTQGAARRLGGSDGVL